jgi:large subunit ribosomal protein L18Ae
MAARHRARFRSIHVIKVSEITAEQVRRPYIQQLLEKDLKFPLPHRVARSFRPIFTGSRPSTIA